MAKNSTSDQKINKFGVAQYLSDFSKVLYNNLFVNLYAGQTTDLLMTQLKKTKVNELKMRVLVLFGLLEARSLNDRVEGESLVTIECGFDDEKLAIGVTFNLKDIFNKKQIELNVGQKNPKTEIERYINAITEYSDGVIVHYQESTKRIEVIALLDFDATEGITENKKIKDLEIFVFGKKAEVPERTSEKYIELGDLNYKDLLKKEMDKNVSEELDLSYGEFIAKNAQENYIKKLYGSKDPFSYDEKVKLKDVTNRLYDEKINVSGGSPEEEDTLEKKVGDYREVLQSETQIVKGTPASGDDEQILREKPSTDGETKPEGYNVKFSEDEKEEKLMPYGVGESLKGKRSKLNENDNETIKIKGEYEDTQQATTVKDKLNYGLIEKKSISSSEDTDEASKKSEEKKVEAQKVEAQKLSPIEDEPTLSQSSKDNIEKDSSQLANTIDSGAFGKILIKGKEESEEVKRESKEDKTKKWIDRFMGDLFSEKSKIQLLSKQLNLSIKQKEFKFKTKEKSYQEELRKRKEIIHKKDIILNNVKEQVHNLQVKLAKAKSETKKNVGGDILIKNQLTKYEKLLSVSQDDNEKLGKQVLELKKQLSNQPAKVMQVENKDTLLELNNMKSDHDRLKRHLEEFKKINKQLMEKLTQSNKKQGTSITKTTEMKNRLEQAMVLSMNSKKEVTNLQGKLTDKVKEEIKLKNQLKLLLVEVKKLKKSGGSSSAA